MAKLKISRREGGSGLRFGLRLLACVGIHYPHPKHFSPFFSGGADLNCDGYATFPSIKHWESVNYTNLLKVKLYY